MFPYFERTEVKRLPTRREAQNEHGLDLELWMGYNHCTRCDVCDGTGYVIELAAGVYLGTYGNRYHEDHPVQACPQCNPRHIMPRDKCCDLMHEHTDLVLGAKYTGQVFDWYHERFVVFTGYLCDQCAQDAETDGATLRMLR